MEILKILVRTCVLFVCGIIQVIGVLVEGVSRLLLKLGEYLAILDDKLSKRVDKKPKKTEEKPAEGKNQEGDLA